MLVDSRAIQRVNWVGLTHQYIAIQDITGVYREDETSMFGRERPSIVIDSENVQIHLGFGNGGAGSSWPIKGLAEAVLALARCGAPIDAGLLSNARELAR